MKAGAKVPEVGKGPLDPDLMCPEPLGPELEGAGECDGPRGCKEPIGGDKGCTIAVDFGLPVLIVDPGECDDRMNGLLRFWELFCAMFTSQRIPALFTMWLHPVEASFVGNRLLRSSTQCRGRLSVGVHAECKAGEKGAH